MDSADDWKDRPRDCAFAIWRFPKPLSLPVVVYADVVVPVVAAAVVGGNLVPVVVVPISFFVDALILPPHHQHGCLLLC